MNTYAIYYSSLNACRVYEANDMSQAIVLFLADFSPAFSAEDINKIVRL